MARYKAEDLYPEVAEWLAVEAELRAQGKSDGQIEADAAYLREVAFNNTNEQFRAVGVSEAEIEAFWNAMVPKDGPDTEDV